MPLGLLSRHSCRYGIGHLGKAFEGVSSLTTRVVHICRGTPGFTKEYDGTGKAPEQDCYASILSMLDDIPVDLISIEHAFCPSPLSVFAGIRNKTVMLGVVDVATQDVEPVELIIARAAPVINMLGSERVILAPDCGFSAWSHPVASQREALYHKALAKLENMVEAARRLNAG